MSLPFRALAIQNEQDGPPGGGAPPAPAPPAAPPPAPPAPPAAPTPPAGAKTPTFEEWVADPVNAEFTKALRKEAADNRVKAQTATKTAEATFRELAKSLGVEIPGGDPLDPAKLSEELAKTRRENLDLKVGSALDAAFTKYGAKPKLTRALLRDEGALRELDPTSADFQRDLNAIVKKAVDDNPDLKAGQAPVLKPPVGAEFPGGGQPPSQQLTEDHLAVMKPAEVLEAMNKGQFDVLLGRTKTQ
jgi:hypothetical protein